MLHRELFKRPYQMRLYEGAWMSILPWWWAVNQSFGLFLRTADEMQEEREMPCWERYLMLLILVPILIILLITMWPFALGGFIVRCLLAKHRVPYRYSYAINVEHAHIHRRIWDDINRKHLFHVGQINSCLQPEFMARLNNLRHVQMRALELGRRIATSQLRPSPKIFVHSPSDSELKTNGTSGHGMALFSISEGGHLALAQSDGDTPCITYSNIKPDETSFYTASQNCRKVLPDQEPPPGSVVNGSSSSNGNGNNVNDSQMPYTFACCSSTTGIETNCTGQSGEQYYCTDSNNCTPPPGKMMEDKYGSITSVPDIVPNKDKSAGTPSSPESYTAKTPMTTPDTDTIKSPSSPEDNCIETHIQIQIQQTPQGQEGTPPSHTAGTGSFNRPSTSSGNNNPPTDSVPPSSNRPSQPTRKNTTSTPSSKSNSPSMRHRAEENIRDIPSPRDHGTCINFPPDLDFVCFQEVFDYRAAKKLVNGLHGWFGHIVYDVGIDSWETNRFLMNSGLVVASRYPIVDVAFECYKQSQNEDRAVSKGLLMIKVHIGQTREGNPIVGFIAVTQLQVAQENNIRSLQMDSILTWMTSFHSNSDKIEPGAMELVAFDVLCGNFNFDNMSPGDMPDWSHPIFLIYHDPCRLRPGCDRPWTKGSLIRRERLHEDEVASPEALQRTIEDPELRGCFLEDVEVYEPIDSNMPWNTPDFQRYRGNGRRRVDYIMFSNHRTHLQQVCEEYAFVTQLATLTDHIPMCMTFSAAVGPASARDWPQVDTPDSDDSVTCKVMYETTV
ncbi:sphingomyelin phosphodiesterase 3-like [Amphiura filiformis]|uniref:sphingomyelin phosphodiesterase 3-like n=1 Tax=Amphiura filiformis TaxID=82378 RepID=UPI003B20F1AA